MAKLTGKVAVVTGASKGIGAGIAKKLAAEGATVVVNYASSREGAEKVVGEIVSGGGKAVAIGGSVANAADVSRLFTETKKQFGKVDVLVNNAGVYEFAPLEAITEESYERLFATNVKGVLLATKAAAALFPQGAGAVVNIGSVVSERAPEASAVYTATKGAVDAITRVLARELGPRGVRVNSVNPGFTHTEGTVTAGIQGSDFEKNAISLTPLGRAGKPEDIADVVAFLASDDARWVTGALLQAGGGLR